MVDRKATILIVDDEAGVRESVRMVLKDSFDPVTVESGEAALEWLDREHADLVLLDILMPGMDGLEVLERIREKDRLLPVVMLTATKTVKTAVSAMKLGAFDYITKPFDVEELRVVVERATENADLKREVEELREAVGRRFSFENIIGESEPMQRVFKTINAVAPLKTTVLIVGESGTGKELIAKAIHFNSPRREKPLVTLNCAAIPENLLESERCRGKEDRPVRARAPGHDFSRRDRRDEFGVAGQAASRSRARRDHARGRGPSHPGGRPRRRCNEPKPPAGDSRRAFSFRPVLSHQRH